MAKLYFKYGTMGSSKTASALMCKFNYEERGFRVLLIKSCIDKRDVQNGEIIVKSKDYLNSRDVVIVDEAQFLTKEQVEQLKAVSEFVPVLCYGLLTNFKTELFEGSKRLVEIADSLHEIKSVCRCGKKANVNARFVNGKISVDGDEILLGGNSSYEAVCFSCYEKLLKQAKNNKK